MVAAAFNGIADAQRPALRRLLVIHIDMEPGGLALDATLRVFELSNAQLRLAIGREPRISLLVTGNGQGCRGLRGDAEFVRTIAQTGNADSGMNAIDGRCAGPAHV